MTARKNMSAYAGFAAFYDTLMDDFDYPAWADYYMKLLAAEGVQPTSLCDCACGTGSLSIEFARRGIRVTGADLSGEMLEIAQIFGVHKLSSVVSGGKTRQQSVFQGIKAAGAATHFAIHDGARALITPEDIQRAVSDGICFGASSLGVPVKDTIKVVDGEGYVQGTPNRALMWNVQTPQVFEKAVYQRAMKKAEQEGADYTDDCQLVEQLGVGVHLCMGSYENIKITTRDDLALGEHILQLREEDA